ncbi:Oxoglutarate/iron-dependent oxygenase [Trifolium repens]|nr:Oxoglutarate/iron-dependent oxygenase [Trifolium repens]
MKHSSYAGSASAIIDPTRVKQASWKPRAIVYQGFLADLECDHLISIAKSELKGSAVVDNFSGETNFQVTTIPILEISRNTLLNLRVLRWGKNNTMDTLRRKTSTTMKIGSTLSLLGSIPIEAPAIVLLPSCGVLVQFVFGCACVGCLASAKVLLCLEP